MHGRFANPRLTDVFGSDFTQDDVEFVIPKLTEDIPLYVDPFLLWNSVKPEYRHMYKKLVEFLQHAIYLLNKGEINRAALLFAGCEEQRAMGLGYGRRSSAPMRCPDSLTTSRSRKSNRR